MNIKWDFQKLTNLLQDFSNVCNINMNIADKNFVYFNEKNPLYNNYCLEIQKSEKYKEMCNCSDQKLFAACQKSKQTETHICHAGLIDIAVPIIWDNNVLGYIILGQMKTNNDFNTVKDSLKKFNVNMELMESFYKDLTLFNYEKVQSVANLATILSKYIFLENIFKLETNSVIEEACKYINDNLKNNISIQNIVKHTAVSKSTLYKNFEIQFNCTPGEYINKTRVEKSIDLLKNTDYNIEEISERVGFSSSSYYSKIFKKIKGISPLKFRQTQYKK